MAYWTHLKYSFLSATIGFNNRKIPQNLTYLPIFVLRLQTFADIGKNHYFQTYELEQISAFMLAAGIPPCLDWLLERSLHFSQQYC